MKILRTLIAAAAVAAVGMAKAESVTVDDVTSGEPWSTITVRYTLSGVDADLDYKVAFDITSKGVTKSVTNAAAKLTSQTYTKTIDTVALFGEQRADPKAKVGVSLIAVKPSLGGVQLWEGGPYWAECNVGATKPEEYGYYFWWGDTVGYKRNAQDTGWISVKDGTGFMFTSGNCPTYGMNYSQLQSAGYIDATGDLVAAHDAATAHLGAPWRMPTYEEWGALISNCDKTWTTRGGVYGRLFTGRGAYASKSIFLPAAGYGINSYLYNTSSYGNYWSSSPDSDYSDSAWYLDFSSGNIYRDDNSRYYGQSVRPLRGFAQ